MQPILESAYPGEKGWMVGGRGKPTTLSYTTCPLVVGDDYDEYEEFDEAGMETVDRVGGGGGWGEVDGIIDSPVAAPGSSNTPKATKTKKANA